MLFLEGDLWIAPAFFVPRARSRLPLPPASVGRARERKSKLDRMQISRSSSLAASPVVRRVVPDALTPVPPDPETEDESGRPPGLDAPQ